MDSASPQQMKHTHPKPRMITDTWKKINRIIFFREIAVPVKGQIWSTSLRTTFISWEYESPGARQVEAWSFHIHLPPIFCPRPVPIMGLSTPGGFSANRRAMPGSPQPSQASRTRHSPARSASTSHDHRGRTPQKMTMAAMGKATMIPAVKVAAKGQWGPRTRYSSARDPSTGLTSSNTTVKFPRRVQVRQRFCPQVNSRAHFLPQGGWLSQQ
mmetsp:Transcript_64598/g.145716  ORF Transcript_64598/g.145716 Transcript_64598/m.145716 type:complete len:213 (+) Transcript_64598:403-1041(+)